uniref:Uncharacterized protein n=1 Tax=Panagrolaimus davidi TaxID=227884 RepID=A0A914R056_9BILA
MSLSKFDAKWIGINATYNLPKSPPYCEFPDDVLRYMKENANPKQSFKLMNVIKYFVPKKGCPFTYFGKEYFDDEYALWNENSLSVYAPESFEYNFNELPNNLGISGRLSVWDGRALPKLISKIIVCDIKYLCLSTPRISYSAFKFLTASGKLKELELEKTIVTLKNGFVVPYETLLENTPKLRILKMTYDPQKRLSKKIVQKICESNLEKLVLDGLTDDFKLESFLDVIAKKKPNLDIHLDFECSFNTRRNIYSYMDKVIRAGSPASFPPHFELNYIVFSSHFDVCRKTYENIRNEYRQRQLNLIN